MIKKLTHQTNKTLKTKVPRKLWLAIASKEVLIRVLADALVVNASLLVALALRFFYFVAFRYDILGDFQDLFWSSLLAYRNSAFLLTALTLTVGAASGFYTYGRAYRGRYKAVVVALAVTIAFVLFAVITYGLLLSMKLPVGVWTVAWLLCCSGLILARLWSLVWEKIVLTERNVVARHDTRSIRTILVIGGAGYIGSALLPKLLEAGYHVRLLDMLWYSREPIEKFIHHPNLEIREADFRQVDQVVEAMSDVDAVVHLGAIVGDPACALDEELTLEINLMATRMIAEVAKGYGAKRFVFASTCSVYGASEGFLTEQSELNPVSLYARSKIACEQVLRKMAGVDFSPIILRFGTIYGLSGRTRFDLVVNLLTAKAIVENQISIFGGDQWRPFLHVDDAALSILKAVQAPLGTVHNQIFNVGSDSQNHTITEVGEIVRDLVPKAELVNVSSMSDPRNYRVDFSKIRESLHFLPQWTVQQGVQQVIDALQSGQVTDYRDVKYSNEKFLSSETMANLVQHENGWAMALINDTATDSSNGYLEEQHAETAMKAVPR